MFVCGSVSVSIAMRQFYYQQKELSLSKQEFDLLFYLMQNPNQICTYEQILADVWGCQSSEQSDSKLIRLALFRLRKKLKKQRVSCFAIVTVRGIGICLKTSSQIETK